MTTTTHTRDFARALTLSDGAPVAIIPLQTGPTWIESDGVIGHVTSWKAARALLKSRGYRVMYAGGDVGAHRGEELGSPEEAAVLLVTVHPKP